MATEADIDALLHEWAAWRRRDSAQVKLGYGRSVIGRLLAGMPSLTCPTCRITPGRLIWYEPGGKRCSGTCPTCAGTGKVSASSSPNQINPAFIRQTGPSHPQDADDPVMEAIEHVITRQLDRVTRAVIIEHYYLRPGAKEQEHVRRLRRRGVFVKGRYRYYLSAGRRIVETQHRRILVA